MKKHFKSNTIQNVLLRQFENVLILVNKGYASSALKYSSKTSK